MNVELHPQTAALSIKCEIAGLMCLVSKDKKIKAIFITFIQCITELILFAWTSNHICSTATYTFFFLVVILIFNGNLSHSLKLHGLQTWTLTLNSPETLHRFDENIFPMSYTQVCLCSGKPASKYQIINAFRLINQKKLYF